MFSLRSLITVVRGNRRALSLALAVVGLVAVSQIGFAQSTFDTVLGTVKDPSGAFVPMAKVDLTNTGTNAVLCVCFTARFVSPARLITKYAPAPRKPIRRATTSLSTSMSELQDHGGGGRFPKDRVSGL